MDKRDFFISYTGKDKDYATWIAGVLEDTDKNETEKYSCVIQAWDFKPGENFVLNMDKALKNCERFIAVLSDDYLESLYCQAEWSAAFTKDPNSEKARLIPVKVRPCEPKGLLASIVYIDLTKADGDEEQLLVNGIKDGRPTNRPSFPGTT